MKDVSDIRTARLHLRRVERGDFDELHAMHTNAEVMATLGGVRSRAETQRVLDMLVAHWDHHGFGYWMGYDLASAAFAGRGGLRRILLDGRAEVEVGYAVMPQFAGNGLATELAKESVRIAFDVLGLRELVCFTLPTNRASQRVMQKAGFRYAGDTVWADRPHVLYRHAAPE